MSAKTIESDLFPVAFTARDNSGSGTGGNIQFAAVEVDTHNAFSGGIYTIPVAGFYEIIAEGWISGNAAVSINVYKNGGSGGARTSIVNRVSNDTISGGSVSTIFECVVGDQITVQMTGGFTMSNVSNNYLNINRIA